MRILAAFLLLAGAAQAAERPVRSRLCPDDLPDGVRLPAPPGCETQAPRRRGAEDGFRDLGNGTSLRIGGRVVTDVGARR